MDLKSNIFIQEAAPWHVEDPTWHAVYDLDHHCYPVHIGLRFSEMNTYDLYKQAVLMSSEL